MGNLERSYIHACMQALISIYVTLIYETVHVTGDTKVSRVSAPGNDKYLQPLVLSNRQLNGISFTELRLEMPRSTPYPCEFTGGPTVILGKGQSWPFSIPVHLGTLAHIVNNGGARLGSGCRGVDVGWECMAFGEKLVVGGGGI